MTAQILRFPSRTPAATAAPDYTGARVSYEDMANPRRRGTVTGWYAGASVLRVEWDEGGASSVYPSQIPAEVGGRDAGWRRLPAETAEEREARAISTALASLALCREARAAREERKRNPPPRSLSTAEQGQAIRDACKARGWNRRKVSVRTDGDSIRVLVLSVDVPISAVREIAEKYEHVRRDASGDYLCGGNTYVHVDYSEPALRPLVAEITAALATVEATHGIAVTVRGFEAWRSQGHEDYWNAHRGAFSAGLPEIHCWGRDFCAWQIAASVADGGAGL